MVAMLGYVFIHRPVAGYGVAEYTSRLARFHQALIAAPPPGFIDSWVWKMAEGPLGAAFEDWYLVEGWTALGALNQAAVTGQRKAPHDEVAPLAAGGAGAVYELVHGTPNTTAKCRARVAKPSGVAYEAFQMQLERAAGINGTVWKRQMVLGPDLEFLIDSASPPAKGLLDKAEITAMQVVHHS
jgi:hypothetical protein